MCFGDDDLDYLSSEKLFHLDRKRLLRSFSGLVEESGDLFLDDAWPSPRNLPLNQDVRLIVIIISQAFKHLYIYIPLAGDARRHVQSDLTSDLIFWQATVIQTRCSVMPPQRNVT